MNRPKSYSSTASHCERSPIESPLSATGSRGGLGSVRSCGRQCPALARAHLDPGRSAGRRIPASRGSGAWGSYYEASPRAPASALGQNDSMPTVEAWLPSNSPTERRTAARVLGQALVDRSLGCVDGNAAVDVLGDESLQHLVVGFSNDFGHDLDCGSVLRLRNRRVAGCSTPVCYSHSRFGISLR